ncbi:malonyl-CoA decarboxylase [Gordonia sp. TBRC 11910]|uniref:Malonyl-CoA decarboxylase n=1 Tax=Gordonia asplenii TaxID=2725283 RepID=A0A848KQV6_9ACTN|nr:malonyl-CoA decarboxylase family protein [Gordonia asplenii]NMO01086.1 malonyl-CoA decarboxylase [Gordonia asplenii]
MQHRTADSTTPTGLDELESLCATLMSDVGDASMRALATRALAVYATLDDTDRVAFFTHITERYDVDADAVRTSFRRWEDALARGSNGTAEMVGLFDVVEPARQQLLRRLNHADGATLILTDMRSDLRRQLPAHPELRPLDHDFHHLLTSWFNRGFLRLEEVVADSPSALRDNLRRYEKVHPMADAGAITRRLEPPDRRIYAFLHPATGDVPLVFVEVALVVGVPDAIGPLLDDAPPIDPDTADTAALYSISNALDGLAGVSFGGLLIKQVIEQVRGQLPHLRRFVTLSPIPGFRRWLDAQDDAELRCLTTELEQFGGIAELNSAERARLRPGLLRALTRYITVERRADGRPLDSVARFHLSNGAAAWRLDWPANMSSAAWRESYGAMINYDYRPDQLERRHEEFARHRTIAVDGPMSAPQPA